MYLGFGFHPYSLIYLLPAVIIALWAQIKVKSAFSKYSRIYASNNLTGAAAAQKVLELNGVTGVRIEMVKGSLTDHFDPSTNVIRLSETVYGSNSVAAVGIASHEAGHAVQHATNYVPIKLRNSFVPLCNIGTTISFPLLLIGAFMNYGFLVNLGIILFSFATLFQLLTLPTEFNASRRAMSAIAGSGMLTEEEQVGAKKMLTAAAMTYVAALITSLLNLLRVIAIFSRRRN